MDEKIYSVTLADGSTIDNLTLNGNNYVSKTKIDKSIFDGNCHSVMISDGESEVVYDFYNISFKHLRAVFFYFRGTRPLDLLTNSKYRTNPKRGRRAAAGRTAMAVHNGEASRRHDVP